MRVRLLCLPLVTASLFAPRNLLPRSAPLRSAGHGAAGSSDDFCLAEPTVIAVSQNHCDDAAATQLSPWLPAGAVPFLAAMMPLNAGAAIWPVSSFPATSSAMAAVMPPVSSFPSNAPLLPDLAPGWEGRPAHVLEVVHLIGTAGAFALSYVVAETGSFSFANPLVRRVSSAPWSAPTPALAGMEWLAGQPLPSLAELEDSCSMVAADGLDNGRRLFLCTKPANVGVYDCEPDAEFSAYYGQTVYVCEM